MKTNIEKINLMKKQIRFHFAMRNKSMVSNLIARVRKLQEEFEVGDLVRSSENENFTYRVTRVGRKYLDVKPIDSGWTDCESKNVPKIVFTKIKRKVA